MYFAEDENYARRLQHEMQAYESFRRQKEMKEKENLNPVDSILEYIDPTPSIQDLFVTFDKKFFWNTLGMVMVVWSSRMTTCAGLCSFEGRRGLCKISLSAPLLTLRPRKDLVETLLHEMIHAYLFITNNYKDRDDHGPEFHKHMYRINQEAGTNITVYHTYHDEVEYYQKHIWRCDGPCRFKKPFFGFVKRASNRAPGPNDRWWSQHQKECGGNFVKIQEPEKKPRTKRIKVARPKGKIKDIREFFTPQKSTETQKISNVKTLADLKEGKITGVKMNSGAGTLVVTNNNAKKRNKISTDSQKQDLVNKTSKRSKTHDSTTASTNPAQTGGLKEIKESESDKVREKVRNVWANKFSNSKPVTDSNSRSESGNRDIEIIEEFKGGKTNSPQSSGSNEGNGRVTEGTSRNGDCDAIKECPVCSAKIPLSKMNDHIENCLQCSFVNNEEDEENAEAQRESVPCPCCYKWFNESIMNDHIDECLTLNSLKEEILA